MKAYTLTNTVNGKKYVGITTGSLQKRMREHKSEAARGSNKPLYKSIRKYGLSAFTMALVAETSSLCDLKQLEIRLISELNTYYPNGFGYNLTLGGDMNNTLSAVKGEQNHRALITESIVKFIRDPAKAPQSNKVLLAEVIAIFEVNISQDCLRDARRGTSWKHLDATYPPIKTGRGTRKAPLTAETKIKAAALLREHHKNAITVAANIRRGKRAPHAKIPEDAVRSIFYSPLSLSKTAKVFGVSKRTVHGIKQRKLHKYLTETL